MYVAEKLKPKKSTGIASEYQLKSLDGIKQLHNATLLANHRLQFEDFWKEIVAEYKSKNKLLEHNSKVEQVSKKRQPQYFVVFYATDDLMGLFEKGLVLGKGESFCDYKFHLSTYPQDALAQCQNFTKSRDTLTIAAGFLLPGVSQRLKGCDSKTVITSGFNSAFYRLQGSSTTMEKVEADGVCITESSQFYPCFELTFTKK
jgi:hypothetical protein